MNLSQLRRHQRHKQFQFTYVIKEYTEHDVKTWIYANSEEGREEYTHHLNQLKEYYKD